MMIGEGHGPVAHPLDPPLIGMKLYSWTWAWETCFPANLLRRPPNGHRTTLARKNNRIFVTKITHPFTHFPAVPCLRPHSTRNCRWARVAGLARGRDRVDTKILKNI